MNENKLVIKQEDLQTLYNMIQDSVSKIMSMREVMATLERIRASLVNFEEPKPAAAPQEQKLVQPKKK